MEDESIKELFIITLLFVYVLGTGFFSTQTASAEAVASFNIAGGTNHQHQIQIVPISLQKLESSPKAEHPNL